MKNKPVTSNTLEPLGPACVLLPPNLLHPQPSPTPTPLSQTLPSPSCFWSLLYHSNREQTRTPVSGLASLRQVLPMSPGSLDHKVASGLGLPSAGVAGVRCHSWLQVFQFVSAQNAFRTFPAEPVDHFVKYCHRDYIVFQSHSTPGVPLFVYAVFSSFLGRTLQFQANKSFRLLS